MIDKIYNYIRACEICQKNKLTRIKTKQPRSITDTPFEPFEKISIDTVGLLPMTPDKNVHILTIQDNFSKAAAAVPLPDIRAVTVADALLNHYIALYGCPRVILSDKVN
ncbi:GSCOCG00012020001-RA-CDS [Cotesia congregata]|nr:GSCOCG00012020001-RA-CDS [Cotesia congregata]